MIPGLEHAEWVRFGQMHRNTFINAPKLLRPSMVWRQRDDLFFGGQIVGTEGYIASTASGLVAGLNASRLARGEPLIEFPPTTMIGALTHYVAEAAGASFQPMKPNFGLLPALAPAVRNKRKRHAAHAERSRNDLAAFVARHYDRLRLGRAGAGGAQGHSSRSLVCGFLENAQANAVPHVLALGAVVCRLPVPAGSTTRNQERPGSTGGLALQGLAVGRRADVGAGADRARLRFQGRADPAGEKGQLTSDALSRADSALLAPGRTGVGRVHTPQVPIVQ